LGKVDHEGLYDAFKLVRDTKESKVCSHPLDQILSDIKTGVQTRSKLKIYCFFYAFLSTIEPKNINEALANSDSVIAMQEEVHQFEMNKVWHSCTTARK